MKPSFPALRIIAGAGLTAVAACGVSGCIDPFEVNVNTPQPIKVDLSMDVHVYQHGATTKTEGSVPAADYRAAMDRRRDRMAEVQELKNNRLVGESHEGLLSIRNRPAGEYGDYVEKTVREENSDRELLMKQEAESKSIAIDQVREEQWRHWQRKSFPGEWIEVGGDDGQPRRWEQKQAAE